MSSRMSPTYIGLLLAFGDSVRVTIAVEDNDAGRFSKQAQNKSQNKSKQGQPPNKTKYYKIADSQPKLAIA